ncbi:MAG: segregation and condensation protein A [Gammaproteobacteria bacterium]|jgi:hypothetical protein
MSEPELTKEERILRMMKRVLTDVAKDTAPHPGLRHPLSAATVQGIRECLALISAREQELAREHGRSTSARPRFIDEPDPEVVVPLDVSAMKRNLKKSDD